MYRIGFPGWKIAARAGIPLFLRVEVHHDAEVDRYWADSPDLRGLVMEAQSLDELFASTRAAALDLLELQLGGFRVMPMRAEAGLAHESPARFNPSPSPP